MDARHATQTPPHLAAPADAARWPGSVAAARELQRELAARIVLKDGFPAQLRTVAGVDVGFEEQGRITRAAVVLLDAASLQPLQQHVVRVDTVLPYIPGMLSFREMPALLPALARLSTPPDLVLVDGQGIAHPRRLGVAAHLGLATGLPTIGVAKSVLTGTSGTLHEMRGAFAPLRDGDEQIGWMLRSKSGCLPLVVSPGHRVSMAAAPELVMRFTTRYRLPEPTRLADRIASRRGEVLVQPAIAEA